MIKKYSDRRRPRRAALVRLALALSALLPVLACSCVRSSSGSAAAGQGERASVAQTPQTVVSAAHAAQNAAAPRVPTPPGRPGGTASAEQPPKSAPALAAGIRAFGLGSRPEPRMPRDFSLGLLQSERPRDGARAAVLTVVRSFLSGMAAGKIDASLFLPEARDALSVLIAPLPAKDGAKLERARIGAIEVDGSTASLRVRLPAKEKAPRREGLLSLREKGGTWYVEALALDPPAESPLAFEPGLQR